MGFSVIPTNIGGVSLNSIASPLAALLSNNNQVSNLTYPSDLGSNPAMGHAVIFQAFDRQTQLNTAAVAAGQAIVNAVESGISAVQSGNTAQIANVGTSLTNAGSATLNTLIDATQAASYTPQPKKTAVATVSLFMPETVSVNYSSEYSEVSMTEELGLLGIASSAMTDYKAQGLKSAGLSAMGLTARVLDKVAPMIPLAGLGSNIGSAIGQAAGIVVNPQMQLLYRGISLREFQLEFILTPKSSAEAQTVKNICDTFTYYSLPDIAGAAGGTSGQYLVPPQLFSIQFRFLGQNNTVGSITNVISSALTNSGLGFLTSNQVGITSGSAAKIFTINTCVLTNVAIDNAPNGWVTYNDGYPVQTRLTLSFKEISMYTKQDMSGSAIAQNYNNQNAAAATPSVAGVGTINGSAGNASNGNLA